MKFQFVSITRLAKRAGEGVEVQRMTSELLEGETRPQKPGFLMHMLYTCYTHIYTSLYMLNVDENVTSYEYRACMCFCTSEFLHSIRSQIFGDNHVQDSKL